MTQMCAEIYPHFQQEQTDTFDPDQKSRFDDFGELIDTPTREGFVAEDFKVTMARQLAQMQAQSRAAQEQAQMPVPDRDNAALARIRANRMFLVRQQEARTARLKAGWP